LRRRSRGRARRSSRPRNARCRAQFARRGLRRCTPRFLLTGFGLLGRRSTRLLLARLRLLRTWRHALLLRLKRPLRPSAGRCRRLVRRNGTAHAGLLRLLLARLLWLLLRDCPRRGPLRPLRALLTASLLALVLFARRGALRPSAVRAQAAGQPNPRRAYHCDGHRHRQNSRSLPASAHRFTRPCMPFVTKRKGFAQWPRCHQPRLRSKSVRDKAPMRPPALTHRANRQNSFASETFPYALASLNGVPPIAGGQDAAGDARRSVAYPRTKLIA
jgi:hypothetical protein